VSNRATRAYLHRTAVPSALATFPDDSLDGIIADPALAVHPAHLPYWARNRVQRVHGRTCAICHHSILRAPRGPAPRHCVGCEVRVRRFRQLRAYLRSAERLATELNRPAIAAAARDAAAALDARDDA
jgi:hypothetical protein